MLKTNPTTFKSKNFDITQEEDILIDARRRETFEDYCREQMYDVGMKKRERIVARISSKHRILVERAVEEERGIIFDYDVKIMDNKEILEE